ncbi:hypothetical protein [uncultured Brevibacillus sp.]|nr:hypothetical protein [uncultured Brevibacillus sp.]
MAQVVAFLASDRASFVTGSAYGVAAALLLPIKSCVFFQSDS